MAVEVVRVALRLHHRLPAAPRAADEVGVVGRPIVVVRDDRLRRFRGQVHGAVAEVLLPSRMIGGPSSPRCRCRCVRCRSPPSRSRAAGGFRRGRRACAPGSARCPRNRRRPPIRKRPFQSSGQQQLEVDFGLDGPGHLAVRRQTGLGGYRFRRPDAQVEELLRREGRCRRPRDPRRASRTRRRPPRRRRQRRSRAGAGSGDIEVSPSVAGSPQTLTASCPERQEPRQPVAKAPLHRAAIPALGAARGFSTDCRVRSRTAAAAI